MKIFWSIVVAGLILVGGVQFLPNPSEHARVHAAQQGKTEIKPVTTKSSLTCFFCQYCTKCHCGGRRKGNPKLNVCSLTSLLNEKPTADILAEYPKAKGYIVPGKPAQSLVWLRVADGSMPAGGRKPTAKHKADLKEWIMSLPVKNAQLKKAAKRLVRYEGGRKLPEASLLCPVTDKPADKNIHAEFLGKKVYFADMESLKMFRANYGLYLYGAYLQMLRTKQMQQVACPILGDPLDDTINAKLGDFKIGFCCDSCFEKFTNKNLSENERLWLIFNDPDIGFTLQEKCPVTGKEISQKVLWTSSKYGRKVWFHSKAARDMYNAKPKGTYDIPPPFPKLDPNAPMTLPRLAYAAYRIIKNRCMNCHNANHPNGAFYYDFTAPGNIDSENFWDQVRNGRMPLDSAPLSFEEKAVLKDWVDRDAFQAATWGKPAPFVKPENRNRKFVELQDDLDAMVGYLKKAQTNGGNPKNIRFFMLTHLHNDFENVSTRDMRLFRAAVSKLVNSLSTAKIVKPPKPIGIADSILAININDYGWTNDQWNKILNEYPYGLDYSSHKDKRIKKLAAEIIEASGSELAFIRGDWFVAVASQPPLYHILADTPRDLTELEKRMFGAKIDFTEAFDKKTVIRIATDSGLTTYQNRLVEAYTAKPTMEMGNGLQAYYYRSYDFDPNEPRSSLVEYPLGPLFAKNPYWPYAFKHGGGEIIYTRPNGMQAYMVVDAKGNRQNVGDIRFLKDPLVPPTANTPALVNGLSCIGCHRRGLNTVTFSNKDFVGKAWENRGQKKTRQIVRDLYKLHDDKKWKEFKSQQKIERKQFLKATTAAMGSFLITGDDKDASIKDFVEPVRALSIQFYKYLGLRQIALELGINPTAKALNQLRTRIKNKKRLDGLGLSDIPDDVGKPASEENATQIKVRGRQRINFGVRRGQDITQFQLLARELGRGTPFWKRYHREPMDVPDVIAQLASDIAGFLKYEMQLQNIMVDLRPIVPFAKNKEMNARIGANLSVWTVLLQEELWRNGLKARISGNGVGPNVDFEIVPTFSLQHHDTTKGFYSALEFSADIKDKKGRILTAFQLNRRVPQLKIGDSEHTVVNYIREAAVLGFVAHNSTLDPKIDFEGRIDSALANNTPSVAEEIVVQSIDGKKIKAHEARVAKGRDAYAIQFLKAKDAKNIADMKMMKLDDKAGAFLALKVGQVFRIRLINRSAQEMAVRLTIDGVTMFAFSPEWYFAANDESLPPPSVVLVPAFGSKIVEGWYINPTEHEPFKVGTYGGRRVGESKRGTIAAVFSPCYTTKNQLAAKLVGAALGGNNVPQLIIQRGVVQVNDRVFQREVRFLGRSVAVIAVQYGPPKAGKALKNN